MNTTEAAYTKMLAQLEDLLDIQFAGDTLEQKAINYYCLCHRMINDDLKAGRYNIHLDFLISGLNKLPDHEGIVYRGIKILNKGQILARYQIGEVVIEDGFLSSSEDIEIAKLFAWVHRKTSFHIPGMFKIFSKTGKSIFKFSGGTGRAREVLFAPNSSFLVLGFVEHDDHIEIDLEQV